METLAKLTTPQLICVTVVLVFAILAYAELAGEAVSNVIATFKKKD
jgi:hypothetical protein